MNGLKLNQRHLGFLARDVLDETCDKHGCQLFGKTVPVPGGNKRLVFCPQCTQEGIEAKKEALSAQVSVSDLKRFKKQAVFEKFSMVPFELSEATFDNFDSGELAAREALTFAKKATRHYFTGGFGNVIMTGQPGVGKSHLGISMLRCLDEQHAAYEDYKSCLFMPVARLFSELKKGINSRDDELKNRLARLRQELIDCDYLVLDDLGKESSYSLELKRANEWVQSVLFEILDSRQRTIITTNFYPESLEKIYDPALLDRIFKGQRDLRHRMGGQLRSRRS